MKSSFIRRGTGPKRELGTRPGLFGQTLISTGLADLDRLLGGGLPLGCLLLILEDSPPTHAASLLRYFVAEGVACGHPCHWVLPATASDTSVWLPKRVEVTTSASQTADRDSGDAQQQDHLRIAWQYRRYMNGRAHAANQPHPAMPPSQRGNASSAAAATTAAVSPVAASCAKDWCHSFHLGKQQPLEDWQRHVDVRRHGPGGESPGQLAAAAAQFLHRSTASPSQQAVASGSGEAYTSRDSSGSQCPSSAVVSGAAADPNSRGPSVPASTAAGAATGSFRRRQPASAQPAAASNGSATVARIAVQSLGDVDHVSGCSVVSSPDAGGSNSGLISAQSPQAAAVFRAIHALKRVACSNRCAVMVSISAGLYEPSFAMRLQHIADAAVLVESMEGHRELLNIIPEPDSCRGMLRVLRLPSVGTLAAPYPEAPLMLIRRRRRRLVLQPVDVDPDAVDELISTDGPTSDIPEELDDDESDCVGTIGAGIGVGGGMLCGGSRPGATNPFDF